MGGYISVLYKNYNIPVYNENQYADPFVLADYQTKNRRYYDHEDDSSCLRLVRYSGMPILYVLSVCSAIVGMICMGIITDYWASTPNPTCFLYSSVSQIYYFFLTLKFAEQVHILLHSVHVN